jgi:hypothetical protein
MIPFLRVACLAIVLLRSLAAAPVSVGDFSFEVNTGANAGNNLTAAGYHYNLGPEWQETAGPGNAAGFEEFITGFVADGTDHLGMEINHNVWQDLAVTYQANTRYTLTVAAGNRSGSTQADNQTQYLLADSTGAIYATGIFNASTLPVGTFADAPALVFDTPNNAASVGKTIRILLQARGSGRSHFDRIRLDATSLTPPGGSVLEAQSATAVTTTSATLNGAVTTIGNDPPSITLFWGTTNGGINPAAWQNSQVLPGTFTGTFSTNITGLSASTIWFFTARATNSVATSWALNPESFETLPPPPTVTHIAASGVGATTATVGATFSSAGTVLPTVTLYYGPTDGGTNPAAWAASTPLDNSTGNSTTLLTGLTTATPYFFRAYAENPGGTTWATASGSFTTLTVSPSTIENRNASGLTGTTATLRGEVTATGNDTPTVTLFYGPADGGTNPANWAFSADAGLQSGNFSSFLTGLSPSSTYYFRSRAVNAAGTAWAPDTRSLTTTPLVPNSAVIHEFHYNSLDSTSAEEFIELHNPGDTALNLSGWSIADAVTYTFPSGTTLPAGGYLIVAENPDVILSKFNRTALGPWTGRLNSSGERIDLLDAALVLRDRVSYGAGFPWPTSANGTGNSAELIHPGLDNDLGGSWRSSTSVTIPAISYIVPQASGWRYFKAFSEASSPVELWRSVGFNDAAWSTGTAPIGIGQTTNLTDMFNGSTLAYKGVYGRKTFTIPVGQIPNQLTLRHRVDDACVIWINGTEVHRTSNAGTGQLAFTAAATLGNTGTTSTFTTVNLTGTSAYLIGGTNVLSIHALNRDLNATQRADFLFDVELLRPGSTSSPAPTPGALNSNARTVTTIPPQIRQVAHSPVSPTAGQAVTITARITDPDGMDAVTLAYQTVEPGSYIRDTDAAYATGWTTLTMRDNGLSGDATANDSIYTVRIPGNVQTHRRLVRYRITFADDLGNSATVPYPDDEQPNFAYFVYNGTPAWNGAFVPGSTPVQTFSSTLLNTLPPFHIIANSGDIDSFQSGNGTRFRAAVVHRGIVHDHVQFRVRGIGSTTVSGKNKWNVYFNRARDFQAHDNFGNPYKETWNNLLINGNSSPWASVNRGSAGIEEALCNRIYSLAGMAAMNTHHLHLRVIDNAVESSPTDQFEGDLWGLYLGLEPTEGNFLDERGLPSGNLYSIEGNGGDKKHQGPTQPLDSSDWSAFSSALATTGQTEAWYRANIDLPTLYTFLALNRLTGNVDVRPGDNYRFYHRPTDGRWVIIPYDLDMQFIAAHHWGGSMDGVMVAGAPNVIRAVMRHPAIAREFRNRCREILSLMASDGTATGGQIGQLFDEYAQVVNPTGVALTWADLDAAMWNHNPKTNGSLGATSGQSNHRGNFFRANYLDGSRGAGGAPSTSTWIRTLPDPDGNGFGDHEGLTQWFVNYATNTWPGGTWVRKATSESGGGTDSDPNRQLGYGYKYLEWESLYGGYANASINPLPADLRNDFPNQPVVTATGDPAFPVSDLTFSSSAFSDPQGGAAAAWQWRIAEISAPGIPGHLAGTPRKYEIEPLLTSAELTSTPGSFAVPYGLTAPGKTYRVRVRHRDTTGNWSQWSAPAQFAATAPPPGPLLHYWNFNALNPANLLNVTETIGGGTLTTVLTGTAATLADNAEGFTAENARNGNSAGNHLRVNIPLNATLNLALPTTGHENIVVKYETRRSGQGAGTQVISYTVNGTTFLPFTTLPTFDAAPIVQVLDFRGISAANDNPLFRIRITFLQGDGGTAGNNRIDNLTVEGDEIETVIEPGTYTFWRDQYFPNPADFANEALSGPEATPAGDGIANIVRYAHGVGPYDPVLHLLPVLVGNDGVYQFRFRFDPALTDLVWKVKASNNLGTWPSTLFDSTVGPVPPLESGWLPVNLPSSLAGNPQPDPKIFARLELQLAP